MSERTWRDEWPPFRVNLIDETARCLANQRAEESNAQSPRWEQLSSVEQVNLSGFVASVFLAMDQAMASLTDRGQIP